MIDIIISLIAAYVIYILVTTSVKEKVYDLISYIAIRFEMALLRIVGLRQAAASRIVIIQVLLFTIPGIIIGLILSVLSYILLAYVLNKLLFLSLPYAPPPSSYIFSILVGLLSPFIAIIPPIVQLAKQKLVESLDLLHSVMKNSILL